MNRLKGLSLAFMAIAIVMPHLVGAGYHPFSLEVLAVSAGAAALFFGIGFVAPNVLHRFILALQTYWLLDAYFLKGEFIRTNEWILLLILFGSIAIFEVVARFFSKTIVPLAAIIFAVVFTLPSLMDFPGPVLVQSGNDVDTSAAGVEQQYAYVHIILDEHMTPVALPDGAVGPSYAQDWFEDYTNAGFQMHGVAMSNSRNTRRSLGGIFELNSGVENFQKGGDNSEYTYRIANNVLVAALAGEGFDVSVIESNYLGLCDEELGGSCETYSRAANMSVFSRVVESPLERLKIAIIALHQGHSYRPHIVALYRGVANAISEANGHGDADSLGFFSRPVFNVEIMKDVTTRLETIKAGEALIVHLMFPHYPYVLDANCDLADFADWGYPDRSYDIAAPSLDTSYGRYVDQADCNHKLMLEMFEVTGQRDDVIFIVHGDHGSRIARGTDQESDMDSLGTFFAVRAPGFEPDLTVEPVSLQDTFSATFTALFEQ